MNVSIAAEWSAKTLRKLVANLFLNVLNLPMPIFNLQWREKKTEVLEVCVQEIFALIMILIYVPGPCS